MGYYISVGGMFTFKNAGAIRDAVADVPLERILLETDAPYLTPVPLRGRRNEPAYVRHVAEFFAKERGLDWKRWPEDNGKCVAAFSDCRVTHSGPNDRE